MISLSANMPISTGRMSSPAESWVLPKWKRGTASMGAMPTVAQAMPKTPASSPLMMDLPARDAIMVREKTAMEKYSKWPKLSATLASPGAMKIMATMLIRVPRKENTTPRPRALNPSPFCVMG